MDLLRRSNTGGLLVATTLPRTLPSWSNWII